MIRVLLEADVLDDTFDGTAMPLAESEQHHLRVRRAAPGDIVEIRNGRGMVGRGRVTLDGKRWMIELLERDTMPPPPPLVLAVGAGDRERFGWLVEKAAEIGVTRVIPMVTSRSRAVSSKLQATQVERLGHRALDALKQSGGAWAPVVDIPVAFAAFVTAVPPGHRWLADVAGGLPPAALTEISPPAGLDMEAHTEAVTLAVGPEGGFDDDERRALLGVGFVPVTLGPYILRFETAALAGALAAVAARARSARGSGRR